jgi:hypothetical protein
VLKRPHSWHQSADADHQRRQQQLQQQRWAQEDRPLATSWHFASGSYVGTGDPGLYRASATALTTSGTFASALTAARASAATVTTLTTSVAATSVATTSVAATSVTRCRARRGKWRGLAAREGARAAGCSAAVPSWQL